MGPVSPYSAGRTALWGLVVLFVTGASQQLALLGIAHARGAPQGAGARADGLAFALSIVASALTGGTALWLVVRRAPREALALVAPRARQVAVWALVEVAVIAAIDLAAYALHQDLVSKEYVESYRSAGSVPLLAFALVGVAPVFEELFFRGFLFGGFARTRLGVPLAVATTSLLFTLVHGPTDAWSGATVLLSALVLAAARVKTGSTAPGVAMHALGNAKVLAHIALVAGP